MYLPPDGNSTGGRGRKGGRNFLDHPYPPPPYPVSLPFLSLRLALSRRVRPTYVQLFDTYLIVCPTYDTTVPLFSFVRPSVRPAYRPVANKNMMQTVIWSLGVLGGSGLGGVLSEPAAHYPSVFSASGVFGRYCRTVQHDRMTA